MKRIWNKLFRRATSDPSMTEDEKRLDREAMMLQQAERQRLQDEMSLPPAGT